ncbi:cytochrome b5-like [Portunus trituberculatus]|uniref:Cytochrome b5 n=1 Tax=Portunus trituberculatus TaxID=210409 RepID=A0A5B7DFL4_PORTR|nr:cytochrome b5-like [Portunus trituberculatus]MPC19845.1 Cytochrome b5 [Portunus trituberculatus]
MAATMEQTFAETPLHMLQPKALFDFASQTLGFVTRSLGYREPDSYSTDEDNSLCHFDIREKDEESGLDIYTLNEVAEHETFDDCWIVLFDKVFDVTSFLLEHPGGEEVILENAGRDATLAFRGVGHSTLALRALDDYLVGIVSHAERIYTNQDSGRRGER